jgi:hypothetical protein
MLPVNRAVCGQNYSLFGSRQHHKRWAQKCPLWWVQQQAIAGTFALQLFCNRLPKGDGVGAMILNITGAILDSNFISVCSREYHKWSILNCSPWPPPPALPPELAGNFAAKYFHNYESRFFLEDATKMPVNGAILGEEFRSNRAHLGHTFAVKLVMKLQKWLF